MKRGARVVAAVVLTMLSGCASVYVDTNIKELTPAERVSVANPQPVQLLFEFQTKGVQNGQATDLLKDAVWNTVRGSGLFSQVGEGPAANGALLHITINNVPLSDDAFAKGFVTGFTFGLVGNTVGDGYVCTVDYLSGPNAQKITTITRDAIYTSLGATASTPQHAQKVAGFTEAANLMARKIVGNGLNDLAKAPGFAK
jgi:hypothetical protein